MTFYTINTLLIDLDNSDDPGDNSGDSVSESIKMLSSHHQ